MSGRSSTDSKSLVSTSAATQPLAWPPAGLQVHHATVDSFCGAYCYLAGLPAFALGGGVLYPGMAPFPSDGLRRISDAPPNEPTGLMTRVLWRAPAGQGRTLYTAPEGWVIVSVTADGTWAAAVTAPLADLLSVGLSATKPWTLVAFDARGTVRHLASSPGGGDALPPTADLNADHAAWAVPYKADAQPSVEDLVTGQARTVPTGLSAGSMLGSVYLEGNGDLVVTAGPPNNVDTGYRLHGGTATSVPGTPWATLATGTALVTGKGSPSVLPPGANHPLPLVTRDFTPLPGEGASSLWMTAPGTLTRISPAEWTSTPYMSPPGSVTADGDGLAWSQTVKVGDHYTLDLWWTAGGA